jgi:CO dehydrogenase nickel-insertion accessory protein CooC1
MKEPVGVMADMEKLEEWVDRPDKEHGVLSVIGFGGVGKTTIATALYRKVSNKFDCRAFVNVSQNYDQEAVLRSILRQVVPQDKDQISQKKQDGEQEAEQSTAKKHLAARAINKLKRAVPFVGSHKQQGDIDAGTSDEKQTNIETMDTDKLVLKVKEHLMAKQWFQA